MKEFVEEIREHSMDYGSIPFWSWNDKLDQNELKRQIHVMHELGTKGFFMHARGGLKTEYLSEEWYDCIRACVEEAEKLDMEAWSYDENGWPSGFAGGKLLEDPANWATYLKFERFTEFPADENLLAVYVIQDQKCSRVYGPEEGVKEYTAVFQAWDSSYVDTMDKEITEKFVQEIHEQYKEKVGFSKHMPGFFTDEPQYYRYATPWSNKMPKEFKERYGYDVLDGLAALFVDYEGAEEFRWDYYRLCHELFINGFIKVVYEWCEENGCQLTGHAIDEPWLNRQMWCCGGIMPFYEYEHIPGMDALFRKMDTDVAPRQLGSACAQLGKERAISEMFGGCGWDVTPLELKRIAERQYVNGVNMMCQHLYPYSLRGERKRDWPCHYSEHLPWQKVLKDFNHYFNHLGYIVSRGKELTNVLVIHPIHSAYLTYKRKEDEDSVRELQEDLFALNALLSEHQIPYHFGDECMMAKMGSVEGNRMKVGLCTYDYVVVPAMDTLDRSTAQLLKTYVENGGKLYLFGKTPNRIDGRKTDLSWLTGNCTFDDLKTCVDAKISSEGRNVPQIRQMIRKTEHGRIFYMVNSSEKNLADVEIRIRGCKGVYSLNLETLDYELVPAVIDEAGDCILRLNFEDSESYVLVEAEEHGDKPAALSKEAPIPLSHPFSLVEPVQNMMALDYAEISYDGVHYEKSRPIILIKDMLFRARYEGDLYLKYSFRIEEIPQSLSVAAEPLSYKAITVNGRPVVLDGDWWFDRSFLTADLAPYIHEGRNEIVMQIDYFQRDQVYDVLYGGVSESLRNCLVFDTEIESIYLFGHFCVRMNRERISPVEPNVYGYTGDFKLVPQKKEIDLSNVVMDGYPFFAGVMEAQTIYNYKDGAPTELYLTGRYAACEVTVNDRYVGKLYFKQHLNLDRVLREGTNRITLRLYNSNRNLLGPHHHILAEPLEAGPEVFSLESMWENEKCAQFTDRYAFVRFGIDLQMEK